MKTRTGGDEDELAHPLGPDLPRWRRWLTRVTVFSVIFVLLITAMAAVSKIVERFFIILYGD
jgi:hypothetical protein